MTLRSHAMIAGLAAHALACRMADDGGAPAADTPAVAASVLVTEYPNLKGPQSFDCALIPAELRLSFLKDHTRAYIANRLNSVQTRYNKDPLVAAWAAFKAASAADPLQTIVARPTDAEPAEPDYADAYARAVDDLSKGNVRKQSDEPKARKTKDPLTSVVTDAVVREVFDSEKAKDAKFTFLMAKAKVGGDGIAYLKALIETKVGEGADRAALEKMLQTRYIGPAQLMLGIGSSKAIDALPSIL